MTTANMDDPGAWPADVGLTTGEVVNITALLTLLQSLSPADRHSLFSHLGVTTEKELYQIVHTADKMHIKSYEEELMVYAEYKIHKILLLYISPILLIVGTIGNMLSFAVLMRKAMRRTSTYTYLAVLSLTDTLVLYVGLLRLWIGELTGVDIRDGSDWSCKLISMMGYTVSDYSVWLLIAVTVERYIVTVHSLHASSMCTRGRAVKTVLLILCILISINLHILWTTQIRLYDHEDEEIPICNGAIGFEYLIEKVWPWVDAFLYCLMPFVIICILNCLIVQKVIVSRRHRHNMLSGNSVTSATGTVSARGSSESSVRVTIMLLSISFTFLICTLPMNVTMINAAFWGFEAPDLQDVSKFRLAKTISELLMYTNHSINFFLYLLTGQKFRQQLLAMLCRQKTWSNTNYSVVTQDNNGNRPNGSPKATETELVSLKNGSYTKINEDTE